MEKEREFTHQHYLLVTALKTNSIHGVMVSQSPPFGSTIKLHKPTGFNKLHLAGQFLARFRSVYGLGN